MNFLFMSSSMHSIYFTVKKKEIMVEHPDYGKVLYIYMHCPSEDSS